MKRKPVVFLLACVSLLQCSCDKFSNGDVIEKSRQLDESFQMIELNDDVNVTLIHCDADNPAGYIVLKTGENLWDNISTEVMVDTFRLLVNGTYIKEKFNKLVIRNNNTLDFLRPYDYTLEMTVYYDSIISILFNSNGTINTDTLRGYNYITHFSTHDHSGNIIESDSLKSNLRIETAGGSGDLNVLMNCFRMTALYSHGTSNINFCGKARLAEVYGDYDCHGIIDGRYLETYNYYGTFNGTNALFAKAIDYISAKNNNIGSIYYVRFQREGTIWIDGVWKDSIFNCPQRHWFQGNTENILPINP